MAKSQLLSKELRDKLADQAKEEIAFARAHKKSIITSRWHKNENLVYGVKPTFDDGRANVGIANTKAQGFVDALLSKIDNPPAIKYVKGEEADLTKAKYANAVIDKESKPSTGNWAMKDLMGKKQNIMYGRTIFEFHASSSDGFKTSFENVDVYDFLIDPSCGGLDIERAWYLGRGNIFKTKEDIKAGIKKGKYLKTEGNELLEAIGGDTGDKEEKDKANRYHALVQRNTIIASKNQYKMWEWYTTYEGERYYLLYSEQYHKVIRACLLVDLFESNLYPFTTWAAYPDLVEFWTPAPLDFVREIFYAQGVSINELLDNAEAINHPMKAVQVGAIKNPNALKYGRNKIVKVNKGVNIDSAVKFFETQPITTPAKVYEILEGIHSVESGINAATRGVAEEDKVGIYEGNLAAVSDRLGLMNKSYSNAYHRLGLLFYHGIIEHMNEKTSIEMVGADGIEFAEITKTDLKPDKHLFDIHVEGSDAELQNDMAAKKDKGLFLQSLKGDQTINQKARFEMEASLHQMEPEDIKRLLDIEEFGSAELMAEAARDIQRLLMRKEIEPNENANVAYAKKILAFMWDNKEHLKADVWAAFEQYMRDLQPIVIRNMAGYVETYMAKQGALAARQGLLPAPEAAGAPEAAAAAIPTQGQELPAELTAGVV